MKHIIRITIWTFITVWLFMFALLRLPAVQTFLADNVSSALSQKLGTTVSVKNIDLRLFNRIIIDDFTLYDQHDKRMLRSGRLSATIELLPLFEGRISISSVQLFGIKADIYRNDASSPLNCQFVIDSLKSKDTTSTTPLDLHIASLVIRNGSVNYDQWDKPVTNGHFSPYHIRLTHISSHISLQHITDDSVDATVKHLSFQEASGLHVTDFTASARYSKGNINLTGIALSMPKTHIDIPYIRVSYAMDGSTIRKGSLKFAGRLEARRFTTSDIASLIPFSKAAALPGITLTATAEGTDAEAQSTITLNSYNDDDIALTLAATAWDILDNPQADVLVSKMYASSDIVSQLVHTFSLPGHLAKAGSISTSGRIRMYGKKHIAVNGSVLAQSIGKVNINADYDNRKVKADFNTSSLNITRLTNDNRFGGICCDLNMQATLDDKNKVLSAAAKGTVKELTYNGYTYHNATIDANYADKLINGRFSIHDPNIDFAFDGKVGIGAHKSINANIALNDFCPSALNLTHKFGNDRFAFTLKADAAGRSIDNLTGTIAIYQISITNAGSHEKDAYLNSLTASMTDNGPGQKELTLDSDFASANIRGDFNMSGIANSFMDIIGRHLPAICKSSSARHATSDFTFDADIKNLDFVKRLVSIPADFSSPVTASGYVNSASGNCSINLSAPGLKLANADLSDTHLELWTTGTSLRCTASSRLNEGGRPVKLALECEADADVLHTVVSWDNMRENVFRGRINVLSKFLRGTDNSTHAQVSIPHSSFEVGDTVWSVHSGGIDYTDGRLSVNHLAIENEHQHLFLNGKASRHATDTITADLKDINIGYIMDLVNFHSVEFDGRASGTVQASSVMSSPVAKASLSVLDFQFENGILGDLTLDADYNHSTGLINLNGGTPTLALDGHVSPGHNSIDLNMNLGGAPLDFMKSFCGSFAHDIDLVGAGELRLHGPFNGLELEGRITTDGALTLTSTNCRYTLENDTIRFIPGDIRFDGATLKDRYGGEAYLSGGVHHRHLGRISYDITARTKRLLAYDFPSISGDDTYCGHAVINGDIGVHGRGNEVNISADCTALPGTFFTYDASSPEALKSQDFITWGSANDTTYNNSSDSEAKSKELMEILNAGNDRTNIRLNFMVNVTPESRLHLLMDRTTGDYVDLFGTGALHIEFYNKGSLDIFGNYDIDHGTYKMTIQNLMRRDFEFQRGGTIAFTGDPYHALLNLQAAYNLNSVSLADLSIGSSFKSDNVPVKCLMDITGTPEKPKIDFGLDLPSLSSDARQMVYSVINSSEEMNQQVLYLLAVGRFLSQSNDDENSQRTKQSTLAMQSFLSGTLSQQLSNILGQVTGKTNWSLGANITPGADGFNNGVYEGILSGRMFNNRLLFNGQFGYRDNINTNTQNFIGDFTLQYLLTPNGNFSLKMYNQSNDRYFTKSSLNTQGIGVVIKKEFGK